LAAPSSPEWFYIEDRKLLESQHAAILNQLAEGVIVADANGRLTFVNEAAARLHGVARLDVEPDEYSDAYHLFTESGEPYPPYDLPLARAVRGEAVQDERWRVRRADGTEVLAVGSARPVFDEAGQQMGAVLTIRDETARHSAEQEVRESEARLRALTDNLPGGVVYQLRTDHEGLSREFIYVSQTHEKLTGVTADAVMADPTIPYRMIHPDDQARMYQAGALAIRNKAPYDLEVRYLLGSGEVRWARLISAPRSQPDGTLIWDGLQIDVTDRIVSQQKLEDLNATLEERVEARTRERDRAWKFSRDLQVVLNANRVFVAANQAWQTILGWEPEAVIGLGYTDFIHPEDLEESERVSEAVAKGDIRPFENRFRHRDGSYRWFSWVAAPEDGLIYASGRHITAEKEAEAALAATAAQLRQSQKMEAMGQLTGGVAHDFNNLLTPIVASLDLLQRKRLGDERERRLIDGAMQSAERAKTLVQRLLAFARRQPLQPRAVDVGGLIEGISDLLGSTLGPRVHLKVQIAKDLPSAVADQNQIEMAVLNLAVNARDAMADGGELAIRVSAVQFEANGHADLAQGQYVCLSFTDTGTGMDDATLTRAIEPFFSTKGVGQGTGLGLSMVHGLAAQLGGGLSLKSAPGRGTTVELYLPSSQEMAFVAEPLTEQIASEARGTVLLVDDEALIRMSTSDMLSDLGYAVLEAGSAEEALRLTEEGQQFDVLVTDHLMPGMSGIELARELRFRRPGLPILVISGYSEIDGVDAETPRLVKPYRQAELGAKLKEVLDGATH
jgi:PAS domain S-box-containing protein